MINNRDEKFMKQMQRVFLVIYYNWKCINPRHQQPQIHRKSKVKASDEVTDNDDITVKRSATRFLTRLP